MRLPFGLCISRRKLGRWLQGGVSTAALLKIAPALRDELLWHARGAFDAGRLDDAERINALVLANWPGDIEALLGLGAAYQLRGDLERAIQNSGLVLAVEPRNPYALVNRAECHLRMGATQVARADLEALSRDSRDVPDDPRRRCAALRAALTDASGSRG